MLAVLLTGLAAVSLLPELVSCDSDEPIHNPSARATWKMIHDKTIKLRKWKEMSDVFAKLDVTERTDFINANQHFWKASEELREELGDVKLMGSLAAFHDLSSYPAKNASAFDDEISPEFIPIPCYFDARETWPQCRHVIDSVRNQRACGSSWAHAPTDAMSDRLCIASEGKTQVSISEERLVSCCRDCVAGTACTGGYPIAAYKYWTTDGLVTTDCLPLQKVDINCNTLGGCLARLVQIILSLLRYEDNPPCWNTCRNAHVSFDENLYRGESYYFLVSDGKASKKSEFIANFLRGDRNATSNREYLIANLLIDTPNVELIQQEIMAHGPVAATINVTSDFMSYKEGVYMPVSTDVIGHHVVKIIGWGEDKALPYWIVVNSWGRGWGENGYARIVRSRNAMNIEGAVTAGMPRTPEAETSASGDAWFQNTRKNALRSYVKCTAIKFQKNACVRSARMKDGWSTIPGLEHNGKCYKIIDEGEDWDTARFQCREQGGNSLASIANSYENAKITEFLKTATDGGSNAFSIGAYVPEDVYDNFKWKGLYQKDTTIRHTMLIQSRWSDESEFQYGNWSTDARMYLTPGICGRLNAEDGSWSVSNCGSGHPALCQTFV